MKRAIWITLGVLAIVLVGLLAVVLNPGVQRGFVEGMLQEEFGPEARLGEFGAGLGSARIGGLALTANGAAVELDSAEVHYGLLAFLFRRDLVVDEARVEGLRLDLSAIEPSREKTPAKKAVFDGILEAIDPGMRITVTRARFNLALELPGSRSVTLDGELRGLAPGATGALSGEAVAIDRSGSEPIRVTERFRMEIVEGTGGGFEAVRVEGEAVAEGDARGLPRTIDFNGAMETVAAGETYRMDIREPGSAEALISLEGSYVRQERTLSARYQLAAGSDQVGPFLAGMGLPDVAARGEGQVVVDVAGGSVQVLQKIGFSVAELDRWDARLAPIGSFTGDIEGDLAIADEVLTANSLAITLAQGGSERLSVRLAEAFRMPLGEDAEGIDLPQRELLRVHLNALPLAWTQPFLPGGGGALFPQGTLSGQVAISGEDAGIGWRTAQPLRVRGLGLSVAGEPMVAGIDVELEGRGLVSGKSLQLDAANLRADSLEGTLLDMAMTSHVDWTEELSLDFDGELTSDIDAVARQPGLGMLDALRSDQLGGRASWDLSLVGTSLTVRDFSLDVEDTRDRRSLLTVVNRKPFTWDLAAGLNGLPAGDLARATLDRLPGGLVGPFIPVVELGARSASGSFSIASLGAGRFTVTANNRVDIDGLDLAMRPEGEADPWRLLEDIDVDGGLRFEGTLETMEITASDARLSSGSAEIARGTVTMGFDIARDFPLSAAKASLEADLAALFQQPLFAPYNNIRSGRASIEFDGSLESDRSGSGRGLLRVTDLRLLSDRNAEVDSAQIGVDGTAAADGSATVSLPIQLARQGRSSDAVVKLEYRPVGSGGHDVRTTVTGKQLVIEDLITVATAFTPESGAPDAAATVGRPADEKTVADAEAAWAGITGVARITVDRLLAGDRYTLDKFDARMEVMPERVEIEQVSARLAGQPFSARGRVDFEAGQPRPYALDADVSLPRFDTGVYFSTVAPGREPLMEGVVSVQGKAYGRGETLTALADRVQGDFHFSARDGILRPAAAIDPDLVRQVSLAGGIASAFLGGNDNQRIAQASSYLGEMIKILEEIPYNRFDLAVNRDASLDINLEKLDVMSPDIRLFSSGGTIAHQPGVSILQQPLDLSVQLGAKGRFARILNGLRLLKSEQDSEGYYLGPQYQRGGSLLDPASNLNQLVRRSISGLLFQPVPGVDLGDGEAATPAPGDAAAPDATEPASDDPSAPEPSAGERLLRGFLNRALESSTQPAAEEAAP